MKDVALSTDQLSLKEAANRVAEEEKMFSIFRCLSAQPCY